MTRIEWADMTVNPVVGCSKCSPGCDNCYAEKMAWRLSKMPKTAERYAGVVDENGWTGKVNINEQYCFYKLYNARKPKRIFVGSMTDLFHPEVDEHTLIDLWTGMKLCSQHTFMLLTKRPEMMREFCEAHNNQALPNVWLGVTVCNQQEADWKIPVLLRTPAAKRFVSIEPMLAAIDLSPWLSPTKEAIGVNLDYSLEYGLHLPRLDWVICGGETGPGARPMHPDWVLSIRDQCQEAGVPFFFKRWSSHSSQKHAGRLLAGREWSEVPV